MPASKRSKRRAAIKRRQELAGAKASAPPRLRGVDGAVAKLRARAQAGETLTAAQLDLLERHGGIYPPRFD